MAMREQSGTLLPRTSNENPLSYHGWDELITSLQCSSLYIDCKWGLNNERKLATLLESYIR